MGIKLTDDQKIAKSKIRTQDMIDSFNYLVANKKEGVIISPIYLTSPRKKLADKKISLNLNWYRNVNFIVNNNMKIIYKDMMRSQLEGMVYKGQLSLTYILYYSHKSDLMNVVSIVDKFFCDALQEFKCILDDNIDYIVETHCIVGGKDTKNPRMEILINNK